MSDDDADRWYDQVVRLLRHDDQLKIDVLDEAVGHVHARLTPMKGAFADELRRLARAQGDARMESRALDALATMAWVEGNGPESITLAREGREVVRGHDDFAEAWAIARLARNLGLGDELEGDDPLLAEGAELATSSGNMTALSSIRNTQMLVSGDATSMDLRYEEAVTAAVAAGSDELEANAHLNYGYTNLWSGRLDRSAEALQRGAAIFERIAPSDGYSPAGLAWLLSLRGDYDRAFEIATPWRAARRLPDRVVALTALAEVGLRRDLDDTGSVVDELWATAIRMGEAQRSVPAASARARYLLIHEGIDVAYPVFMDAMHLTLGTNLRGSHWPFSPTSPRHWRGKGALPRCGSGQTAWTTPRGLTRPLTTRRQALSCWPTTGRSRGTTRRPQQPSRRRSTATRAFPRRRAPRKPTSGSLRCWRAEVTSTVRPDHWSRPSRSRRGSRPRHCWRTWRG